MNPDIFSTFRRGCFSEAKQLLETDSQILARKSPSLHLRSPITFGDLQRTLARGLTLQRAIRDKKLGAPDLKDSRVRHMGSSQLEHAIALSREAHQASLEARDSVLVCRSAADLLERTCNERAFHASLPLSSLARRAAYR